MPEELQPEVLDPFRYWRTVCDAPDCLICSVPGVWYS